MIRGWQDEFVQWSQDYSSILCLPISDPVPKTTGDAETFSFLATPSGILMTSSR